jgi:phenylacetate-CoA ligase
MCLSGGGMSSESRLKFIEENRATIVCCTPTYALRLAEVAGCLSASPTSCSPSPCGSEGSKILVNAPTHKGSDYKIDSVRMLIVAGEPGGSVPSIRQRIENAWGARVIDHWGMTEVGPLAAECAANPGGLHLLETECLAEIIDPVTEQSFDLDAAFAVGPHATTAPIRGELVITNFGRVGSPVIRYRTGDLVELDPAPCPCGRSLLRLKGGILGRVDDMLTIRGNNVFPTAIEAILREFFEIVEYRFDVVSAGSMQELTIAIEPTGDVAQQPDRCSDLLNRVIAAIHDRLHFRPEITIVEPGTLPRHEMKGLRIHRVP